MRTLLLAALLLLPLSQKAAAQSAFTCTHDPNSSVNLRSGPGRNYRIIASIPAYTDVYATQWVYGADGMRWFRVFAGGLVGWSRSDYLCGR